MQDEVNTDQGAEAVSDTSEAVVPDVVVSEAEVEGVAPDFGELDMPSTGGTPGDLSILHDLTMPVAIELGRTSMSVKEILSLSRGSVVQLDRLAGEPIDVFVGDRLFAEGEVVIVGEQFGVRVTRIVQTPRSEVVA